MKLATLRELDTQAIFRSQKRKCGGPLFSLADHCQMESSHPVPVLVLSSSAQEKDVRIGKAQFLASERLDNLYLCTPKVL